MQIVSVAGRVIFWAHKKSGSSRCHCPLGCRITLFAFGAGHGRRVQTANPANLGLHPHGRRAARSRPANTNPARKDPCRLVGAPFPCLASHCNRERSPRFGPSSSITRLSPASPCTLPTTKRVPWRLPRGNRCRCYRYYTPAKDRHYGAGASNFGSLPAESIEALVVEQVWQVLRAPESVQAVWDRVRASAVDLDEARVVMPMRQLVAVWPSLFPAEQRRLAQLLIERVLIGDDGLEILWRDAGWVELIDELRPGSIGAELAEVEMTV